MRSLLFLIGALLQKWVTQTYKALYGDTMLGVSNGPIQFESARKIWSLLKLLAKNR